MTKDNAAIRIALFCIIESHKLEQALLENKDYEKQLYVSLKLTLPTYTGAYTLDELLENKEVLFRSIFKESKTMAEKLG